MKGNFFITLPPSLPVSPEVTTAVVSLSVLSEIFCVNMSVNTAYIHFFPF